MLRSDIQILVNKINMQKQIMNFQTLTSNEKKKQDDFEKGVKG